MKAEKIKTNLKPRDYYLKDVCRILNQKQQTLYIKNGVYPIDIYQSKDSKTDADIIVMIFDRKETTDLYNKWCNYELR